MEYPPRVEPILAIQNIVGILRILNLGDLQLGSCIELIGFVESVEFVEFVGLDLLKICSVD